MTKAYSSLDDNGFRCERCNKPETVHQGQAAVRVLLGGGLGWGTMWMCKACIIEREKRGEPTIT